ncbi:hypothetical protein [Frankia sp. EI5c]|uniref:hypothetical protein n=1 Tax=Frankia sp. EI5c TaxID=683316 RepID=UPI0018FF052D|nr:hypothetical protein [Frankia sp. EI5c]
MRRARATATTDLPVSAACWPARPTPGGPAEPLPLAGSVGHQDSGGTDPGELFTGAEETDEVGVRVGPEVRYEPVEAGLPVALVVLVALAGLGEAAVARGLAVGVGRGLTGGVGRDAAPPGVRLADVVGRGERVEPDVGPPVAGG